MIWHGNGSIYATAEGLDRIYRIDDPLRDQPKVLPFATGQKGSHMMVVSADGRAAWTANLTAGTATRIDLYGRMAPVSVVTGEGTEGIALSPDGSSLWVSAREADTLIELDPATMQMRRRIPVGTFPLRVAVSPDGKWIVTSDLRDGAISVVSAEYGNLTRSIRVSGAEGAQQVTLIFSPDGKRLYAAETALSKIAEIDFETGKVLGRLSGGVGGDGLAIIE